MTTIRKILTIGSLLTVFGFAQDDVWDTPADSTNSPATAVTSDSTASPEQAAPVDTVAQVDSVKADTTAAKPADSTAVTTDSAAVKAAAVQDSTSSDSTEQKVVKPRNKITYAEYQARRNKKRTKTLHHGLTLVGANYHDKRYGHMDHDDDWGSGIGMYYFYRRYFGNFFGMQGRFGGIYRYSRWNFDNDVQKGTLSSGESYKLIHNIDRKYHNFAIDMPLTGKFGYHVKGTTAFLFTSLTLGLTKPLIEIVDTENNLYLKSSSKTLTEDQEVLTLQGENSFPLHESHQSKECFFMDDWETNSWIGVGIESRLVSIEFQVFAIGASTKDNHRYYHIGHDSNLTWRLFLDFSLR